MPLISRRRSLWLPIIAVLIAMVSVQSGASLAKSMLPQIGAPGVTALRLALGTLILAAIFKPWRIRLSRGRCLPLLTYGMSLGCMNYLFYLSLHSVPLGIAVALEFTGPLTIAIFSSRRALDFIWVVLAVSGLYLLLPLGSSRGDISPYGALCALGAGACWAGYILAGRRAGSEYGTATVALGSMIAAFIFVPLGVVQAGTVLWQWKIIPLGLVLALLSTAIPYSLEMIALTRLPARTFGMLMSLDPAIATLFGLLFLGEKLNGWQTFGLLLVVIASAGTTLASSPRR